MLKSVLLISGVITVGVRRFFVCLTPVSNEYMLHAALHSHRWRVELLAASHNVRIYFVDILSVRLV